MLASDREGVARAFVIARHVPLQAVQHFFAVQRGLNVLEMQQQPQFKTGHRSNGLKYDRLPGLVPELAIQRGRQRQRLVVAVVPVPVKHGIHLLKRAALDVLAVVALFKQRLGVLHHLDGSGSQCAGLHLHMGCVQAVRGANLTKIVRLGLAALRNDQDAVVTRPLPLLALKLLALALLRRMVAGHQCGNPRGWLKKGTPP